MAPAAPRPVSILIAALGGQGGGVLTDWVVAAAEHAGLAAQATSIPGVAQRTGATTYYLEVHPVVAERGARPVFSLYPTPGDVDVIIASEFLEAGRTLELDYASPERTTLVASTHRLFAIGERTVLGDGVFPQERLREAVRALTRRAVAFDALAAARAAGSEVNAVLLGAFAATGALPIPDSAYEAAIREGVAAEKNLAGFKAGREIAALGTGLEGASPAARPWPDVRAERAAALGRRGPAFLALCATAEAALDPSLHATVGEALARLIDFQDARYAERCLALIREVQALGRGTRLTERFARRLAVWATYEDAIRVADLKTRRARFDRIRTEQGAPAGAVLVVTDYLKPDLDEIYGILPAAIGRPIARWAERRWPAERPTLGQHVRTTTIVGFLRVWLLGRLRGLRPSSLRAEREWALIERWRAAVLAAGAVDTDLAIEVAETAGVVRGYGEVRRRLAAAFTRLLDEIVAPAMARDRVAGAGYASSRALVAEARRLLLADERGIEAAVALATRGA